jgi:hypothetical protein
MQSSGGTLSTRLTSCHSLVSLAIVREATWSAKLMGLSGMLDLIIAVLLVRPVRKASYRGDLVLCREHYPASGSSYVGAFSARADSLLDTSSKC